MHPYTRAPVIWGVPNYCAHRIDRMLIFVPPLHELKGNNADIRTSQQKLHHLH